MKMTIISELRAEARVPTITFSVYRDNIYPRIEHDSSPLMRLQVADAVLRYNFVLGNFAMVKDRWGLGGREISRRFLNNIRLTHDLRIAEEKDLMWFSLQYKDAVINHVVDVPDIEFEPA